MLEDQMKTVNDYLIDCHEKKLVDVVTVLKAQSIASVLERKGLDPDVTVGANQSIMLALDNGNKHLEFECLPDGTIEYFFLYRDTNKMLDGDIEFLTQEPLFHLLTLFSQQT